jgi:anhydro-N-acetylmuramic acid kinase
MSGTSIDGVDAALIETNGAHQIDRLAFHSMPYEPEFADRIRAILGRTEADGETIAVERELTLLHAKAVDRLLESVEGSAESVDVVGFHGHTIHHEPARGFTWQIGDGALLAAECGIDVVADCRSADVADGGEGAPLAPIFHAALMGAFEKPVAVLNIGGVANVTWIGKEDELMAFDTGPGNALIDDWAYKNTGKPMDRDGAIARRGDIDLVVLEGLLKTPYLKRMPPKSLDRNEFDTSLAEPLLVEDGAATLTAFTIGCIKASLDYFPALPVRWVVCGGGRRNPALMAGLGSALGVPVEPMEALGWDGDAIEAQAFAYLAVRKLKNLPTSFPETTGVAAPTTGGILHRHKG